MKKIFIFLTLGLFMISLASAGILDTKIYEQETETVIIKNSFLGIPTTKLTTIQLITPHTNYVGLGYQKVAELNITTHREVVNFFEDMKTYDILEGMREVDKKIDYKLLTYKEINLEGRIIKTEEWVDIEEDTTLEKGDYIIGLFTEVFFEDEIEWIPTFAGEEIPEWATYIYSNISFAVNPPNAFTVGITTKDDFLYILAGASPNKKVYKYNTNGTYTGNSFSVNSQDSGAAGITWDGTNFWMIGTSTDRVYRYSSAWAYESFSFDVSSKGSLPSGLGWDGTYLWIGGQTSKNAYAFYQNGTDSGIATDGASTSNSLVLGIAWDGEFVWTLGSVADAAFAFYQNGTYTGQSFSVGDEEIFPQGIVSLNSEFWVVGTQNQNAYKYIIDNPFPIVLQIAPEDNIKYTTSPQPIDFICYGSDNLNFSSMEFYLNGILNGTNSSGLNNTNYTFQRDLTDGIYNWSCIGEDGSGAKTGTGTRFLSIDSLSPIINIQSPNGTIDFGVIGGNEVLNVTFTDTNLNSCWYNYNGTNITIEGCLSGIKNSTEFVLEDNNLNMTIYANDTFGNLNSNFISWNYILLELSTTYDINITEGEINIISTKIQIGIGSSITDSLINYGGINFSTGVIFDGENYTIISNNNAPIVSQDTNFSFHFIVYVDGVQFNTSMNNQTIINLDFSICGGVSNDTLLDMSLFDEETLLSLVGNIEFNANIISKSSGDIVETVNGTFNDSSSGAVCLSPVSSYNMYFLDTEIRYFKDGYSTEFYHIQKADLGEYPKNLSLFPLNQNESTEFSVTYKNNNFIFTEGAVVQLQRKYIGEDIYRVVEAPVTAVGGEVILHIDLNTNKYRASVVKDGELLDFFDNLVFSCANELSGDCTHSLQGTVSPNNDVPVESITDFSYSVSIDEDNQTVTVLFAIPSGTPSSVNVLLDQIDMFGNLTSCDTTIITSAGSITCDYTNTIEKSILQLSISKDDVQLVVLSFVNDPELDMDGINFFIIFLFMISLVGMAIASPEWMIIISVMVLIIGGTLLLVKGMNLVMGLGAIAWIVVAAAIMIFKMAKQEDR